MTQNFNTGLIYDLNINFIKFGSVLRKIILNQKKRKTQRTKENFAKSLVYYFCILELNIRQSYLKSAF